MKQPVDFNTRLAIRPRSLKRLSRFGVATTTKTWLTGGWVARHSSAPSQCFSWLKFHSLIGSRLVISSIAVLNSDIMVIVAVMLEIVCQIRGECVARKTHRKRSRYIVVVRP